MRSDDGHRIGRVAARSTLGLCEAAAESEISDQLGEGGRKEKSLKRIILAAFATAPHISGALADEFGLATFDRNSSHGGPIAVQPTLPFGAQLQSIISIMAAARSQGFFEAEILRRRRAKPPTTSMRRKTPRPCRRWALCSWFWYDDPRRKRLLPLKRLMPIAASRAATEFFDWIEARDVTRLAAIESVHVAISSRRSARGSAPSAKLLSA